MRFKNLSADVNRDLKDFETTIDDMAHKLIAEKMDALAEKKMLDTFLGVPIKADETLPKGGWRRGGLASASGTSTIGATVGGERALTVEKLGEMMKGLGDSFAEATASTKNLTTTMTIMGTHRRRKFGHIFDEYPDLTLDGGDLPDGGCYLKEGWNWLTPEPAEEEEEPVEDRYRDNDGFGQF